MAIGAAFVAVALVLAVFAVGYVAMARHITNAGALYAYVSRGLGRPVGIGAALIAALAYNALQVGLYGMFGPTLAGYLADKFGLDLAWLGVRARGVAAGGGPWGVARRPEWQGARGAAVRRGRGAAAAGGRRARRPGRAGCR